MVVGCILAPAVGHAVEIECDRTILSSCYINKPVVLAEGEELTIAPTENVFMVSRFDTVPQSVLRTFPRHIFDALPHVRDVSVAAANIRELNQESFRNASTLESLNLSANNLTILPKAVFMYAPEMVELILSSNQIAEIEDEAFSGLAKLQTLKLNNNRLKVLHTGTFVGLTSLEYLHLYWNQLETIEMNALTLPNLQEVFFAHNKLTTLPDDLFERAPKVAFVGFEDNQLKHIGNAFTKCDNMNYLNLENNPIEDVDLSQFATLKSLSVFSLNNTNLNLPLTPATLTGNSPVHSLNLANNHLANADLFEHLAVFPNLKRLYLDNNKFTGFKEPQEIRQLLPKLDTLDFEGNKMLSDWLRDNSAILQRDHIDVQTKNVF